MSTRPGLRLAHFHRLLRDFATTIETTAYQKRFGHLSRLFFNVKSVREDFHWLHHEFLRYGLEQASDSIVHPRMLRGKESERRFISQSELASRLGVIPVTLRKLDDKGLIAMRRIDGPAGPRYIADSQAIQPPLSNENDKDKILEEREAAAVLKLPVSVLARLKADGHFAPTHRIKFKGGYHQADVDAFLARLLALSPRITPIEVGTQPTVSLSHALRKYRMHDPKQKASLVRAYLSGELRSVGRTGDTTEDILFKLEDITALVASSRAQAAGGALTQKEAAQAIECDPQAIWLKQFGATINDQSVYSISIQNFCARFQEYLATHDTEGIVIADFRDPKKNSYVSHSVFTQKHKRSGDAYPFIQELPTFGVSNNHACLQIADLICSVFLAPMAARKFLATTVSNVHTHAHYDNILNRYKKRVRALQFHCDVSGVRHWGVTIDNPYGTGTQLFV